jgi:hypothetical protein
VSYDSRSDTIKHIGRVADLLNEMMFRLYKRSIIHDASKLEDPEKPIFDEYTPKLKELTYGSDEYKTALAGMGSALEHHYEVNSHHPEHYANGIAGMSLLDLIEMLCDWKAATERHENGDLRSSMEHNEERFGIDEQLAGILFNTAHELGWI